MIHIINIDSVDDFLEIVKDIPYQERIKANRSLFVYRGLPNAEFKLETSLRRNCGELSNLLEPKILSNFKKYAISESPSIADSEWQELIVGQHYGLPTRLLDWSHSALVAAHFAVTESDFRSMTSHDCAIWRLDMREMNDLLPSNYKIAEHERGMEVFTFDMLEKLTEGKISKYDEDMGNRAMVVVEPPSIDPRIVSQYSFFAVVPSEILNIEKFLESRTNNTIKYIINKNIRWKIRDLLDESNISERMIYPGLAGISQWLKRHYYNRALDNSSKNVRDENN